MLNFLLKEIGNKNLIFVSWNKNVASAPEVVVVNSSFGLAQKEVK